MSIKNKRLNVKQKLLSYLPDYPGWCGRSESTIARAIKETRHAVRIAKESCLAEGLITVELMPYRNRPNDRHIIRKSPPVFNPRFSLPLERSDTAPAPDFVCLNMWMDLDRMSLIEMYLKSGFVLHPARNKVPVERMTRRRWNKEYPTLEKVIDYFYKNPDVQIAHWLDDYFVVDFDYKLSSVKQSEANTTTRIDGVTATPMDTTTPDFLNIFIDSVNTLTVETQRGFHFYLQSFAEQSSSVGRLGESIDTKCNGSFIMLPDNTEHCNYRWNNLHRPAPTPQEIQNIFQIRRTSGNETTIGRSNTMKYEQAFDKWDTYNRKFKDDPIPKGTRHTNIFLRGRTLHRPEINGRKLFSPSEIKAELYRVNDLLCQPPFFKHELNEQIAKILTLPDVE